MQACQQLLQWLAQGGQRGVGFGALAGAVDQLEQLFKRRAAVHRHLTPEQVEGLDAVGTFVDRVEAVVAVVLLHRVIAGVAVTAENLDGQLVGLEAELRRPGFDDRG